MFRNGAVSAVSFCVQNKGSRAEPLTDFGYVVSHSFLNKAMSDLPAIPWGTGRTSRRSSRTSLSFLGKTTPVLAGCQLLSCVAQREVRCLEALLGAEAPGGVSSMCMGNNGA